MIVDSLYLLIPIALVIFAIAMRFLFWAITSGQYDNLDTEAYRILFDDDELLTRPPGAPGQPGKQQPDKQQLDKQQEPERDE